MFTLVLRLTCSAGTNAPRISRTLYQKCINTSAPFRSHSQNTADKLRQARKKDIRSTLYYVTAAGIVTVGMSYAAVPLYRMFCQAYSYGGTTQQGHDSDKVESMQVDTSRPIKVKFNADRSANMRWNFKPQQNDITVYPGETALAFYTAVNPTDKPVIGISTYNVIPFEAGKYFNKIQCFCFEEQMLNPHEQVDMPVFFYIDPEFNEDPYLEDVGEITLSYTFFEAKEGFKIPIPQFAKR
ncbi:cytochrome c oxidase assembly protein COX11, mitochondrial [Anthonomus grandis grandis]|uniref:cytochrome c oxidase assembly protein COX11, mitochondrial n=1 Tax=Anthonomus grandis grandis TaxID=2921223 RepID=UPI0021659385|nr:cytochrome c oxidase assembly protein COX11, mitochondrial [Anthonomus grandis grandis]